MTRLIYHARTRGALLTVLGVFSVAVAIGVPILVPEDKILAFVLMSLPAGIVGLIALGNGYSAWKTRIEMGVNELTASAPAWRGCPLPPVRKFNAPWQEIRSVRHRTEVYYVPLFPVSLAMRFPVEVYAVETPQGMMVLGGKTVPRVKEAIQNIAAQAHLEIREEGSLEVWLLKTLFRGAHPWNKP
jgi:hypothetical protein